MKLSEIAEKHPELEEAVQRVLEIDSIDDLYPPQEDAIKAGVLDGKSLVLSIPTASGKTLIAELACVQAALSGGKAIYLVPLRALAAEKHEDFTEKYGKLVKIGVSTGDYDSSGAELGTFDILILTVEKMDSLMRHSPDWLRKIRLVVLDEIHLIDSPKRGPTLEIVATKLMEQKAQFLALSATIENGDELADWLGAELVESNFRPVKLSRGVFFNNEVCFKEKKDLKFKQPRHTDPTILLAADILEKNAQSLVFVNTRRGAEKQAEETGKALYESLDTKEKKELVRVADKITNVLDSPTRQCKRLASCIMHGAAFHHAGLHSKQRSLIEKNFKQNLIKVICATPTLAAGVNLPGKRVIIRDYKRYGTFGMEPISILEIHQMFGRAGRPKYDTEGEAVVIAKTEAEFEMLWDHYIEGRPEPVTSKLGVEPILRMHALGIIAEQERTKESLLGFFEKTFYAHQYSNMEGVERILDTILDQLFAWGFIDYTTETFKCTRLGLRVAQLYIDPLTAYDFIQLLSKKLPDDTVFLTILSDAAEMRPLSAVRRAEEFLYDEFEKHDLKDEQLRAFKNAFIFLEWMSEKTDDNIYEKYGIPPGTLRTKLQIADWLLYSCSEIARLMQKEILLPKIMKVRKRLRYGVKAELLPLVRIRNIGRARARKMFNTGIKNVDDIKAADKKTLSNLIGGKTAEKILKHVE